MWIEMHSLILGKLRKKNANSQKEKRKKRSRTKAFIKTPPSENLRSERRGDGRPRVNELAVSVCRIGVRDRLVTNLVTPGLFLYY
ncbi:uncharacterized protein G2W53_032078 [Senna tora]|uniref:Uncharacterized protein n=1 Tax=Senna tora TaxID=362788 RepID=A0A834W6H0_9FABA|nr:uncharacterized protein G2W53_032078 [Senna tora]